MIGIKHRFEYLDSLRGLAALSVVLSHFFGAYNIEARVSWIGVIPLHHLVYDGYAAVSFFFVLSGFILSYKLFGNTDTIKPIEFAVARLFRIYPPFLFVFFCSVAFSTFCAAWADTIPTQTDWVQGFWKTSLVVKNVVRQALFKTSISGEAYYVPQGWTLGVELILSMFIPFLVVVSEKGKSWLVLFVVMLMTVFNVSIFIVHFALGLLLAHNIKTIKALWARSKGLYRWTALLMGIVLYGCRYTMPCYVRCFVDANVPVAWTDFAIWMLTGVGSFLIICVAVCSVRMQKVLMANTLRFLGQISYSIYLVHFMVLLAIVPGAMLLANQYGIMSESKVLLIGAFALITTTIGCSYITRRFVEEPSIEVGRMVIGFLRKYHRKHISFFLM